eukprot:1972908-Amphidinium_carterae.4
MHERDTHVDWNSLTLLLQSSASNALFSNFEHSDQEVPDANCQSAATLPKGEHASQRLAHIPWPRSRRPLMQLYDHPSGPPAGGMQTTNHSIDYGALASHSRTVPHTACQIDRLMVMMWSTPSTDTFSQDSTMELIREEEKSSINLTFVPCLIPKRRLQIHSSPNFSSISRSVYGPIM